MEEKRGKEGRNEHENSNSYPKDLPWQELKAKVHIDETAHDDEQKQQGQQGQKVVKVEGEEERGYKGLPHQQVPQPDDFSAEALEHL